ncbi:hypothetical protein R1T16_15400 [Flavobacterium sp. DG1-102-2]|uniref:DUF6929 family protein n=1 Tax=Flavobacterium sp. DG1-102-2 TaxID=3081663 RepID=UPI00294A1364|nr:hypothetical protein [Flavobacterium sp. DG1-102-2]MDV6169822.1 hypothetical protein [Flavobacterium sp. DG1-102-2]
MQKFQLEVLFHIIGIGSASGLFFNGTSIYVVSDNSHLLYEYSLIDKKLEKINLAPQDYTGQLENVPKKEKRDFEAIAALGDDLYLFGSGSTEKRNTILHVDSQSKKVFPAIDATDLYLSMQEFGEINKENFNIEAAVNAGSTWYLFNRGNGPKKQNGVFTLEGDINETSFQFIFNEVKLPKINGFQSSFTDAVLIDDKLYFLAAAEKTTSTYKDGEVAGTLIGRMDTESMEVEWTQVISQKNKFEGITLYKKNDKSLEFLLSEDTDSDATASDIYKLTLEE